MRVLRTPSVRFLARLRALLFVCPAVALAALGLARLRADDVQGRVQANETGRTTHTLNPGRPLARTFEGLRAGETYALTVSVRTAALGSAERVLVTLEGRGGDRLAKPLHAGDPDLYLPYRPSAGGPATLNIRSEGSTRPLALEVAWAHLELAPIERAAIEAEPNDDPRHANPLVLGRDVYGSADDVDYLENKREGEAGLDWFRLDVPAGPPVLVYFQLDLLDRDVSANLRVYSVDEAGKQTPYETGKDPMEIVHDRERERYSKHISRTFTKGTYYLEVNANHPSYILRTRKLPVPPYDDPQQAVEAGMHYIMNVGDAWFAQVPREGNIFVRANNIHDTGTRCTACHPSSFSTESNLVAHRNGYPIRSKSNFQYVIDRLYNSITPLYGDDGLYWQRFIAIPLQAQGKQGGIVADFEREVSGQKTALFERFGPFLKAAWVESKDLPPDELNGVVPLDSKFGFAWRDWRVLSEMAARTGRDDYKSAAENVAKLLTEPAADKRIETLQDRIHRLYAWWLIDREKNADRIAAETKALLALQNDDGGWYELDGKKGASAVYTTGQLTWTLLRLGHKRDEPAIDRALVYILSQQQPFGGWFQTSTHENFRTPMRETRYAVEALAEAYPKEGAPLTSWGNRDEKPAQLPKRDSIVQTLDDLENLWDVPEAERAHYAREVIMLLDHPLPIVRGTAAACLGRLGREEAVAPLVAHLADPSKMVWRDAAWALRRLGNQGIGVEAIKNALASDDPLTRRGATRVFAYQFPGMDTREEIAERLMRLTADADLWTRLQALKTLRQWFYRTGNVDLQQRIVATYLDRMALPEEPVIRKNLAEGMYIMLDENLGGGVSLQKNVESLPKELREGIFAARKTVEREVLLEPVLAALERGNELQREALVRSFDGTFFKGRFYARQPEGMLDVGNDREFGFLYDPPVEQLDRTFAALLNAKLNPEARKQAIALASFFQVPNNTKDRTIQLALLDAMADTDESVREAARAAVSGSLALRGAERDPERVARVVKRLQGPGDDTRAILRALGRNEALLANNEVQALVKLLLAREDAALLLQPVLTHSSFSDEVVLDALTRGWPKASNANDRLALLNVLLARRTMLNVEEPPDAALDLLRRAVTDPSAQVRERTLNVVSSLDALWAGKVSTSLLLAALADDTPSLRLLGLKLAASKNAFWQRPDAREHLLRLLVDADPKVRTQALAMVEKHKLIAEPAIAKRVKVLADDSALKDRALKAIKNQGLDPNAITADVRLARPRLLSLSAFREKVNPIFYQAGEDGTACAKCHANHTILRIAEADPARGFSGEDVMTNYNSILKVINLGDPESSLVLRKPRSPQGQGQADVDSPTGLTHVGGPRWDGKEHPAYKAILAWIQEASSEAAADTGSLKLATDSYSPNYEPALAADGDLATIWHTEFVGASPGYPHELTVDLGASRKVNGLLYVPRQDSANGRVKQFEVRLSSDGKTFSAPAASGKWANDPTFKFVALPGDVARYVQLRGLSEVNGQPFMSAAEVVIDASPVPSEPTGGR